MNISTKNYYYIVKRVDKKEILLKFNIFLMHGHLRIYGKYMQITHNAHYVDLLEKHNAYYVDFANFFCTFQAR